MFRLCSEQWPQSKKVWGFFPAKVFFGFPPGSPTNLYNGLNADSNLPVVIKWCVSSDRLSTVPGCIPAFLLVILFTLGGNKRQRNETG